MDTQVVRALLNPMRIRIFDAIMETPASPNQLASRLEESLALVSYHVGVMRTTGCLRPVGPIRPRRGDQCMYELTPVAAPARRGIGPPKSLPPSIGHPSAGVLRAIVDREAAGLTPDALGKRQGDRLGCMSVGLDRQGLQQVAAAITAALNRVSTVQAESAKRLAGTGEEAIETTIALASFNSSLDATARPEP